jgi:hypothetical protein
MRAVGIVCSLATVSVLDGSRLPFRLGQEFFLSPYSYRPDVRPTQPLVQWVPELFPGGGVKRPGCGADHPRPSSTEFKNK